MSIRRSRGREAAAVAVAVVKASAGARCGAAVCRRVGTSRGARNLPWPGSPRLGLLLGSRWGWSSSCPRPALGALSN